MSNMRAGVITQQVGYLFALCTAEHGLISTSHMVLENARSNF